MNDQFQSRTALITVISFLNIASVKSLFIIPELSHEISSSRFCSRRQTALPIQWVLPYICQLESFQSLKVSSHGYPIQSFQHHQVDAPRYGPSNHSHHNLGLPQSAFNRPGSFTQRPFLRDFHGGCHGNEG